ncbi:hypothetical protein [Desemzia sp. FAM 24101]
MDSGEGNVKAINTSENLFQSLSKEIKGDSLGHLPAIKDFSPYTIASERVTAKVRINEIETSLTSDGSRSQYIGIMGTEERKLHLDIPITTILKLRTIKYP